MLSECIPKLNELRLVRLLRSFFRSGLYSAVVVMLMVCSALFGWELPVYYLYFLLVLIALLFSEDTLAIVPPAMCGYMTFAAKNNPMFFPETHLFSHQWAQTALIVVAVLIAILLITRFVFEMIKRPPKKAPALAVGLALLGVAYLLGGAFTGGYSLRTVFFGLVDILAISFFYLYLYFTVDWKSVDKTYIFEMITILGVGMLAEVGGMYLNEGVFTEGGVMRHCLFPGWGTYNNIGCVMAFCVPAPFYFAATRKRCSGFSVLGCVFYLGVLLTQSRGAMLFGTVVLIGCIVAVLFCSKREERIWNAVVFAVVFLAVLLAAVVFREKVERLFASMPNDKFSSSGRIEIYKACWQTYITSPFFGVGFYRTPGAFWNVGTVSATPDGYFLPAFAHNTYLQLLASTGTFGLLAYFYHRFETLALLFRRPTPEKLFIALMISAILLTSLVDVHFFAFGPGIHYSIVLVFAEGLELGVTKGERANARLLKSQAV